jgi:5-methylcytosine-specific restriction endonuclease McrA
MSSTLILNADCSPISILPLSVITWEESIRYLVSEKAAVLEWHQDWIIRSERWSTRVPAIMMLHEYQKKKSSIRFSKSNVFLRDQYRCQYCGTDVNRKTATLDHVLPTSLGGETTWENCTTSCHVCNSRKGNNQKIVPKHAPYRPSYFNLVEKRKSLPWDVKHPSWLEYLA